MKRSCTALMLGLVSLCAQAQNIATPIDGISASITEEKALSIQNIADTEVKIDIYGDEFTLPPMSGLTYECVGYTSLEIQLKGMVHDYFEVPCNSQVTFNETFSSQE
ncbi:hypothetical protein MHO82_07280 [Vibrio sp. Of7-15]|uniref:hypothetical protein n=1 Tax=Vibrio sp. Of7-15 TaxID=2724879 RepID=UPI001EF357C6|nr:hypothetical protein [Vibrio sp. Of7-15]MCG7496660.1 hypothetical protein [Vibrio sp. Of7-15]